MIGVGLKKLARTPVPELSPSYPPLEDRGRNISCKHRIITKILAKINQSKVNLGRLYILL